MLRTSLVRASQKARQKPRMLVNEISMHRYLVLTENVKVRRTRIANMLLNFVAAMSQFMYGWSQTNINGCNHSSLTLIIDQHLASENPFLPPGKETDNN